MKSFVMTFDEQGKPKFNDMQDKAYFDRLLSAIKSSSSGKVLFTMTIETYEKGTTGSQMKLWNTLIGIIARETGNDFQTTSETLLSNYSKEPVIPELISNSEFQDLLQWAIVFSNEFFNLNIQTDDQNHFEIKKM